MIDMRRRNVRVATTTCSHAGLLLDRGFERWRDKNHNTDIVEHHKNATKITTSDAYTLAYQQWQELQLSQGDNSAAWFGKLENRMFLGLGNASPLEAGITLHHTYGVPVIPGSAIKGVVRHFAFRLGIDENIHNALFGREASATDRDDSGEAGYIIFNDAWWIPHSAEGPLTPEVVTVHHGDYYSSEGKHPATDFDSPNPNPQIAIQGSFMFSLEGDAAWVKYAIALLQKALEQSGIGAKSSSGYGYFTTDTSQQNKWQVKMTDIQIGKATPKEKLQIRVNQLTLEQLPLLLGRNKNATLKQIGEADWQIYLDLIREKFAADITDWNSKQANKNQQKAYKLLYSNR